MGRRGPGAKPVSARSTPARRLRKRLPWQRRGLSRAERVIAFCEDLPITAGKLAGTKMKLRPWQRTFILEVYAEDEAGRRPIRTAVLSMGRKNGKTQLAAALGLCHLAGPEAEPRGECYSCALTRDQAAKIFAEMAAILDAHAELGARCNVKRFHKQIEVMLGEGAGSIYAALSADAPSKLGLSPSFAVYDELGSAPNRHLLDAMDSAMGAREDPLFLAISTQAAEDHHPFSEMVDYGLKVLAGEIDDKSFHLALFAAPPDADPFSREAWEAANPALGDFRSLEDVERQAAQARLLPSKESAFRNLILNQRVAASARFINKAEWLACGGAVDPEKLRGKRCFGGLDLSASRDLTALVLAFFDDDGGADLVADFFMPEEGISQRSDQDRVPYDRWAADGFISLIPGPVIDPAFVARRIAERAAMFDLAALAYDRWRIEDLRRELDAIGCKVELVAFGQGFRDMAPAVDKLERLIADRKVRHGGQPVLAMCAANATVTSDAAGNRKLDKSKATGRIDGLVAAAMALSAPDRFEERKPGLAESGQILEIDF